MYAWSYVMQMPAVGFRHLLALGVLSISAEEEREPPPQQPGGHEKKTKPWLSPPDVEPCRPGHCSLLGPSIVNGSA